MPNPDILEIDYKKLSLTTKTKEGFTLKTTYYSKKKELHSAAKIINLSLLRSLELQH